MLSNSPLNEEEVVQESKLARYKAAQAEFHKLRNDLTYFSNPVNMHLCWNKIGPTRAKLDKLRSEINSLERELKNILL